jgi:hypothetical protein
MLIANGADVHLTNTTFADNHAGADPFLSVGRGGGVSIGMAVSVSVTNAIFWEIRLPSPTRRSPETQR